MRAKTAASKKSVIYDVTLKFRSDPETRSKLEACVKSDRARKQTNRVSEVSRSSVIRGAIGMYYDHYVRGHSFIAESDPRFDG